MAAYFWCDEFENDEFNLLSLVLVAAHKDRVYQCQDLFEITELFSHKMPNFTTN